ncbi:hypothetical protein SAMN06265349_1011077 [Flavobacterium resistens]|uniref:DKNYY family protein n=1 Tax=Flavobacterium resistens TaxID=443612 RepID=A0A521BIA6_9FLAO|nr:hypothetical protein [Flavobacterium resistens]MRX67392.1 hypothetical protein [Flavobacterium resistens]SMO46868.1 hypothetical protein SAMN06265349_1011077 [Flavobacterium resistens]
MNPNKLAPFLAFLLFFTSCKGHEKQDDIVKNNPEDTIKHFIIGYHMLVPKLKEIRTYEMIGGETWDGHRYSKDPKIDYEKTTLLILGNSILFKEYFPFPFNLDKLKLISSNEFMTICRDDNYIYYVSDRTNSTQIHIADYKPINDFVYKSKDGALFFLDAEKYKLNPVKINVDENSIKHLAGNYYSDKNGLYFFGAHYKKNVQSNQRDYIEKSEKIIDAKNVVPFISKHYLTFGNQVFAIDDDEIKKLDLNPKKLIEVYFWDRQSLITDGKNVYSNSNYGYDDNRNEKGTYGFLFPSLFSGSNLQKIYPQSLPFANENNSIVFNKGRSFNSIELAVVINNENYILSNKKKIKTGKMLFYHSETKTNGDFDEKYLKIFKNQFLQYKNVLYFDDRPVEASKLDLKNLRQIENSNYLTDGKSIFYTGGITGMKLIKKNGAEYAVLDERIIENVYTNEMKAINPDLLSDGITLISRNQKATIKELKLNVKIAE